MPRDNANRNLELLNIPPEHMEEICKPLIDLGRRWASSPHRPRPSNATLAAWDKLIDAWAASSLPLILRDSRRRGEALYCSNGRQVIFGDNTPANWVFAMALGGMEMLPNLSSWTADNISSAVPLTFLTKGIHAKRDLNKKGWKVCHIEPVSDRKRYKTEIVAFDMIEAEFRRFLSPRNIFLIPKTISGAGELPEVIQAIKDYEALKRVEI